MEYSNILEINNQNEFRQWLSENHDTEHECYVELKRGKPVDNEHFRYLDAIEEALCLGWVDSTIRVIGGREM